MCPNRFYISFKSFLYFIYYAIKYNYSKVLMYSKTLWSGLGVLNKP